MTQDAPYLDYRVRWCAGESRPGTHASRTAGRDGDFRGYRPFWQLPDASRIDVRRSIMDPFGGVVVRQTEQRSAMTLMLALDVSRSMAPSPDRSHMGTMADMVDAAARATGRAGDALGVLTFDEGVRTDLFTAPCRQPSILLDIGVAIRNFTPAGRSGAGIRDLADHLPKTRCLIILASDFLMPAETIATSLAGLARHDVAPVVVGGDDGTDLPRLGLVRVRDAETGSHRLVFARPALQRRARAAATARRVMLDRLFTAHGRSAFYAGHSIDLAALSQHLTAP